MRSVRPGVAEIRIRLGGELRVLYLAKFAEAIYLLHAFQKRTRRTPELALAIARARLRQLRREREHQGGTDDSQDSAIIR